MASDATMRELGEIWNGALERYHKASGIDLTSAKERGFTKLPQSVDDLFSVLDEAKSNFEEYRKEGEAIRNVLKPTVLAAQRILDIIGGVMSDVSVP